MTCHAKRPVAAFGLPCLFSEFQPWTVRPTSEGRLVESTFFFMYSRFRGISIKERTYVVLFSSSSSSSFCLKWQRNKCSSINTYFLPLLKNMFQLCFREVSQKHRKQCKRTSILNFQWPLTSNLGMQGTFLALSHENNPAWLSVILVS